MSAERTPVAPAKLRLPSTPYLTYLRRVHIYRRLPPPRATARVDVGWA